MRLKNRFFKDEVYYDDLYDLWTVEECLRICEHGEKSMKSLKDDEVNIGRWWLDLQLYFVKGERYRGKRTALEGWMVADRKRVKSWIVQKNQRVSAVLSVRW